MLASIANGLKENDSVPRSEMGCLKSILRMAFLGTDTDSSEPLLREEMAEPMIPKKIRLTSRKAMIAPAENDFPERFHILINNDFQGSILQI